MTSRLAILLCLSGLAFGQAAPGLAQTAPTTHLPTTKYVPPSQPAAGQAASAAASSPVPTTDTYDRSAPCSDAVIRGAAAKQIAPPLVGCPVAGTYKPLLQFFVIVPRVHKTDSAEPAGQILSQSPAAGAPLDKAGKLSFDVSTGKAPSQDNPATTSAPATSAAPEKPPETSPVSSAAPEPTSESPATAPSSEAAPAEAPISADEDTTVIVTGYDTGKDQTFGDTILSFITHFPLVLLVGLGVFAAAIAGLAMNGRKTGRKSSKALPHVTCEATFGPGRLVRRGPLVLGEKGGR